MIKFDILSDNNLELNEVLNQILELTRAKKIIRNHSKTSQKFTKQNAEDLISFIEEHRGKSLALYNDGNIRAILFKNLKIFKLNRISFKILDEEKEKFIKIVDKYLNENIQDLAMWTK